MIIGLGSDLCSIERIQKSVDRWGDRFLNRVFTETERAKAARRPHTVAGTLAIAGHFPDLVTGGHPDGGHLDVRSVVSGLPQHPDGVADPPAVAVRSRDRHHVHPVGGELSRDDRFKTIFQS